jgi:hypothetical protein
LGIGGESRLIKENKKIMCQGKKDCGCGCTEKKPLTEAKQPKEDLREGTWAPDVWDKNVAIQAKNVLQGLIENGTASLNVATFLDRFERKYFNKIGDDKLYDLIGQASDEFIKKLPNWKETLSKAIMRIDILEGIYQENEKKEKLHPHSSIPSWIHPQGKYKNLGESKKVIKEEVGNMESKQKLQEKINLKLTSNTKIELVKQAKTALDAMYSIYSLAERRDIEHNSFLDMVDKTFENISELLAVLISQESIEIKK